VPRKPVTLTLVPIGDPIGLWEGATDADREILPSPVRVAPYATEAPHGDSPAAFLIAACAKQGITVIFQPRRLDSTDSSPSPAGSSARGSGLTGRVTGTAKVDGKVGKRPATKPPVSTRSDG
jgi:hypothetical protein